jgi:hypothetical protein
LQVCNTAFHLAVHAPVFVLIMCCVFAVGGLPLARIAASALCFVAACLVTHTPGKTLIALIIAAAAAKAVMFITT